MLVDNIKNTNTLELIFNGTNINIDHLKDEFYAVLEHGYFAPSFVKTDSTSFESLIKNDYWLKLTFSKTEHFKDYSFDVLYIPIKPKCNWLTIYREIDSKIESKCININLATKTTKFYKTLEDVVKKNISD